MKNTCDGNQVSRRFWIGTYTGEISHSVIRLRHSSHIQILFIPYAGHRGEVFAGESSTLATTNNNGESWITALWGGNTVVGEYSSLKGYYISRAIKTKTVTVRLRRYSSSVEVLKSLAWSTWFKWEKKKRDIEERWEKNVDLLTVSLCLNVILYIIPYMDCGWNTRPVLAGSPSSPSSSLPRSRLRVSDVVSMAVDSSKGGGIVMADASEGVVSILIILGIGGFGLWRVVVLKIDAWVTIFERSLSIE